MEVNVVSKLRDFSKLSFQSKLEIIAKRKENRCKRFAQGINTNESFISERVEPYYTKKRMVAP